MLKERHRLAAVLQLTLDLAAVSLAFLLAYEIRTDLLPRFGLTSGRLYPLERYLPLLPIVLLVAGALLVWSKSYKSQRWVSFKDEVWTVIGVSAGTGACLVLALYFLRPGAPSLGSDWVSRLWIVLFVALSGVLLLAEKLLFRYFARLRRIPKLSQRQVLIAGINETALRVADLLENHRLGAFRIVGFVRAGEETAPEIEARYPVLGGLEDIVEIVERTVVDEVIFSVSRNHLDRLEKIFLTLEEQGICTRLTLDLFPHARARIVAGDLNGMPLVTFSTVPQSLAGNLFKRLVDIVVSAASLILLSPLLLTIALLIKLGSRGPVLFAQVRSGLNGRTFKIYKFRSMVAGAESRRSELEHLNEMSGPVFKVKRDPRVTGVGRLLRQFSLDELPQLWNVLKGDMSLVGPRPPLPSEVAQYERWQRRRLSMRPGLTCLWQVSGRNQVDFRRWMELDLQYIDSWSLLLDLKILLRTIPTVLSGRGAS